MSESSGSGEKVPLFDYRPGTTGERADYDTLPADTIFKWVGGQDSGGPVKKGQPRPDGIPAHGAVVVKQGDKTVVVTHLR
mmetsp:Transcript_5830/g.9836  ORF Transcript_5830/g.9836 Transcript_5830/m.9836 type:complete len:80 (-) Transcript_5830:70-309(-)